MIGYLIDVENSKHGKVEIGDVDRLGQFYELIGCECIDIAVRNIGGKPFNVVLDDEGLLVERPVFSAIDSKHRPMLAGNLVIMGIGDDCDLASVTDEDIALIRKNMLVAVDRATFDIYPVVVAGY